MNPDDLNGTNVIDTKGNVVGEIGGLDIDIVNLRIAKIYVNLSDYAIEKLGYEKKLLGNVQIELPIKIVNSIRDVVVINKSTSELKAIIKTSEETKEKTNS